MPIGIPQAMSFIVQTKGLFWILCLCAHMSWGQTSKVTVQMSNLKPLTLKGQSFYIENVEDQRKTPGAAIGKVIIGGNEQILMLPSKAEKVLFDYWTVAAPRNKEAYLPLNITIKDLTITEKKEGANKVSGKISLNVTFRWYRDMQPVTLTSFETAATFVRPESTPIYESLCEKVLNQAIENFQKWMITNEGKSSALARNLVLVFKEIKNDNAQDTVFYDPKRPLIWSDFKGTQGKPGSKYAAAVFTSFAYEGRSYPKGKDVIVEISLKTFMVKSMSWGRPESRSASTLRHEQLHFDVTRVVVERFKERLRKAELTVEDHNSEIQYQFLETWREMNAEQAAYDGETGHGINGAAQAKWDRKISDEISKIYAVQ